MELITAVKLIQNEYVKNQPITNWADLGCGSGLFTYALATYLEKGSTIYAVDTSKQLQDSITPGGISIKALQADFVKDVLPIQQLDGILMANALHYVKDKLSFIHQTSRYTQSNARFLIVEYDTDKPVKTWVPYPVSFASLETVFKTAGYSNIQRLGSHPSVFGNTIYAAIIQK
ncbi:MAG: class I SAM-dependent methyltransferase [Agriterribacter sp.]